MATALDELADAASRSTPTKRVWTLQPRTGRAMLEMAAAFAKLERGMIRERVKAGLGGRKMRVSSSGRSRSLLRPRRPSRRAGEGNRDHQDS